MSKKKENRVTDHFWGQDYSILYDPDRVVEFFPTSMTTNEKLNAIARFLIYLGCLLFVITFNYNLLFIPIIGLSLLYLVHHNDEMSHTLNLEQFDAQLKQQLHIKPDTPLKITENGDICQMPSPNNPFGNILITDYTDNPERPPACSQGDDDVKQATERYFNYNLYQRQ